MAWELIEVAGNRTPLPHSTVDVVAAKIESKVANTVIRQLNQICPLENLRHVKRVRRRIECEKSELSIILCLSTEPESCKNGFPEDVQKVVKAYQLTPFIAKVASYPAMSKEEWEEQCKLWPTSYHPLHDTGGASGFKEDELPSIFGCMRTAIQLSEVGNTAIIVDPSSMQIISKATDQTHQHDASQKRNRCVNVEAGSARSLAETAGDNDGRLLLSSSHVRNGLNMEVSCMNPWGWTKQRSSEQKTLSSEGGFLWHPLRHAAIVAIENASERDRMMFHTSTSPTTELNLNGDMENCSDNEPAKWPKIVTKDKEQAEHQVCSYTAKSLEVHMEELGPGTTNLSGSYTAKSCYKATFQGSVPSASWKFIWKSWAPPRVRFFHWLADQDRCWTSDRLARRGLQHHDPCLLCCQDPETMDHLLLRCPFSRQVWQDVITWLRLPCAPPSHESSLLAWWQSAKQRTPQPMRKGFASMALLTPWMIWKHRNSCVFEGTQPSVNDLVARIKDEASLWTKAGAAGLRDIIHQTWDVH